MYNHRSGEGEARVSPLRLPACRRGSRPAATASGAAYRQTAGESEAWVASLRLPKDKKKTPPNRSGVLNPPAMHGNPALRCNAAFPVPTRMRERVVAPALHGIEESGGP